MVDGPAFSFTGFKVEVRSGNSILFTAVEADLGFPLGSVSLPYTATPQEFKIGSSQGRASMPMMSPTSRASSKALTSSSLLELSLVPELASSLTIALCSELDFLYC